MKRRILSGLLIAAMMTGTNIVRTQDSALEMQANLLGSSIVAEKYQIMMGIFCNASFLSTPNKQ